MSFFHSDSPEEDDILYGWEFDSSDGRYYRIYKKHHCAPFPRPAPSYQQSDHVRPLYVKHLDGHIDEYLLECMFSPFGTVTGTKISWSKWGLSRGFGFVWFASDREAEDACYWMDGRPIEGTELYVAPAEYWEDRQARLAANSGWYDDDYYQEDDWYDEDDYYDEDDSYEDYQPAQPKPKPASKQNPASKPSYQQQTTATNPVVIVTEPRGPPSTGIACSCGTYNTPAQKLKLASAGCAAA